MKSLIVAMALMLGASLSLPAAAQFQKPEDAIKYRKAVFTVMANHLGRIGAMANGKVPFNAKLAAENAEVLTHMASLPWSAFVEGSDKGETRAQPDIWKETDKVKASANKMQEEIIKLNAAAKSGDLAQIKAAFNPVAKTCKSCHDQYRKE
jgi:cytochrome c556